MRTKLNIRASIFLLVLLLITIGNIHNVEANPRKKKVKQSQIDTLEYNVYKGKIKDIITKEPLIFATISVKGTNSSTISNNEGEFILKIAKNSPATKIEVSYIGYKNKEFQIADLKPRKNFLKLKPANISLTEVNIYPHDPNLLIRGILQKVKENYSTSPNMMEAFYRETIKKNRSYVAISEAIVNIRKASYTTNKDDQVQIYKGRKSQDVKRMDTLLFKLQGGPVTTILLDVIKNPYNLLTNDFINSYHFKLRSIIEINNKLHYIIDFQQRKEINFPLYYGTLYVETKNLALTSAKFSLNLENISEATRLFIKKKPMGVKVTPTSADYIVNYHEKNGKWYFNYARGEVNFKCNWKRKLFNKNYKAMSEIAITNRTEDNIVRFKRSEKFKANQILTEEVKKFSDKNFWGKHNTIEPDQSIESAIRKLQRKNR